jgi:hypothetical protein
MDDTSDLERWLKQEIEAKRFTDKENFSVEDLIRNSAYIRALLDVLIYIKTQDEP